MGQERKTSGMGKKAEPTISDLFKLTERILMKPILVNEIIRAGKHLGNPLTAEQQKQLTASPLEELIKEAQLAGAAVSLCQQIESLEFIRKQIGARELEQAGLDNLKS